MQHATYRRELPVATNIEIDILYTSQHDTTHNLLVEVMLTR